MAKISYFAYGSNMNPERMKERGINFKTRKRGVLKGWRLEFNKIASRNSREGYANIVRDENGIVEGCVYEIEEEDIKKLDSYEGYPVHYERTIVEIETNGIKIKAITYIANPDKVKDGLRPSRDYLEHLLKGSDCLSEPYFEKLKSVKILD